MSPLPQHSHSLPTCLVPPPILLLPAQGHPKNGDTTKSSHQAHRRLTQPRTSLPFFQGDPHRRTQRVPELRAFQGPPRLLCPWVGGSLRAGVPGLWARCRCPLPVPARPGLGVAHILPVPRTQSSRRGRSWAGRAPWIPAACPGKRQPLPGAATAVGLKSPHRWGEQGETLCPCALPSLCLGLAGCCRSGAAVPSLSPSTPYPTPHPVRTSMWWPLARTTVTMTARPSRLSPPATSLKLKSRSEFSPLAAPLSQTGRASRAPHFPPMFLFDSGGSSRLCHPPRRVSGLSVGADPQAASHPEKEVSCSPSSAARGCPQPLWLPRLVQSPRGSGEWCCGCLVLALPQG